METKTYFINSQGQGMDDALEGTEVLGTAAGLQRKEVLRLRLLAEELFGLLRSISGRMEAAYQAAESDKCFSLSMTAEFPQNRSTRKQLLSVSTKGTNAAARSFMGKIRDMIEELLLPDADDPSLFALGVMGMGASNGDYFNRDCYEWSMQAYKAGVEDHLGESSEADAAWDEMEKAIVANIADDVSVSIKYSEVIIVITKAF